MKPKYKELHEARYREVVEKGLKGWGGDQVPEREKYWTDYWNEITSNFKLPDKGEVLELGSGAGNISGIIASHGFKVTGIEISPTAVQLAIRRNENLASARFFEMSVTDLSLFVYAFFDVVFDGLCLQCIIGDDRDLAFKEIHRVLKPGGIFLLNSICDEPKDKEIVKNYDPVTRCTFSNGSPYRYFGKKESLIGEITSHGFDILRERVEVKSNGDSLRAIARRLT